MWCTRRRIHVYKLRKHTSKQAGRDTLRLTFTWQSSSSSTNKQTNPPSNTHFSTIDELRKIMSWKPITLSYQQVCRPMTFTFTTRRWIINTTIEHCRGKKRRKLMKFVFCVDNVHTHTRLFSFFRASSAIHQWECRRHHHRSCRHFINSVLFVRLFHGRIFLVIYFPFPISGNFCMFLFYFTLRFWLTLFARHFTEIPSEHFCCVARDNNNNDKTAAATVTTR